MKFIQQRKTFPKLTTLPNPIRKILVENPEIEKHIKWDVVYRNEFIVEKSAYRIIYFYTHEKVWYMNKFTYCYGKYREPKSYFSNSKLLQMVSNKSKQKVKEKIEALIIKEQPQVLLDELKR